MHVLVHVADTPYACRCVFALPLFCLLVVAAYALGFLDCKDISARCMLTIFQFFATKTDASVLRMLNGSPAERLLKPITDYVEAKGGRIHLRQGCK
jgi:uncharacterized protein with NAD-binding domain and iron-sulfur cluster